MLGGPVGEGGAVAELIQNGESAGLAGDAQERQGLVQNGESLLPGDIRGGSQGAIPHAGGQTVGLGPGHSGVVVVGGGYVSKGGGGGDGRLTRRAVEHQQKVAPADVQVRAELSVRDAAHQAVGIAVVHGGVGPVPLGHVLVGVLQGDRDGLALPAGRGGEGSGGAPGALSGEQSVLGDGADAALHRPGDGSHVPHGSPGPVGTLGSELDLVSRLQGEGGEGVGAVLPGDGEAGEMVHYVDLGGALHIQIRGPELQGIGARVTAGGVDVVLHPAQVVQGGDLHLAWVIPKDVQTAVQHGRLPQVHRGAGEDHQPVIFQHQPVRIAVTLIPGDQEQVGGAGPGLAIGGDVDDGGALLAGDPDTDGGGAAAVQVDRPDAALGEHLLRQIQLAQSAGVAAPAAVHSVQDQGAVLPHAQGGAGVAALFHIGPGSGVSDLSVPDHHIAHAAGPLGVLEGGGGAVGVEGDPVAHLEALEYGLQAAGVGGSQYVLVLANDH